MTNARSSAQIIKAVNDPRVALYRVVGSGYWYFAFDDGKNYETESVYTPRLSDMTVDQWCVYARDLIERMDA